MQTPLEIIISMATFENGYAVTDLLLPAYLVLKLKTTQQF
jgi:hypothetical protein